MNIPPEYTLDEDGNLALSETYKKLLNIKEILLAQQIMWNRYRDLLKFEFSFQKTGPWEPRIRLDHIFKDQKVLSCEIQFYKRTSLDNGKTWHGPFKAGSIGPSIEDK